MRRPSRISSGEEEEEEEQESRQGGTEAGQEVFRQQLHYYQCESGRGPCGDKRRSKILSAPTTIPAAKIIGA
jgi:hypothetical protein